MRDVRTTVIVCLLTLLIACLIMHQAGDSPEAFAQGSSPTETATPTPTLTPNPTPTPTPTEDASERILGLYGEMTATSTRTIEAMKWLVIAFLSFVTLAVGIAGGLTVYRSKVAEDKASEANATASLAQGQITRTEKRATEAEEEVQKVRRIADKLAYMTQDLDEELQNAKVDVHALGDMATKVEAQIKDLERTLGVFDKEALHFLATLQLIDRYRRTLFSIYEPQRIEQAEWALLEKTITDSPLIRRESVRALSGMEKPGEGVIKRFKEIVDEEDDPEVKRLAEEALRAWKIS